MTGKLLISFSGGRTSGYMTRHLLQEVSNGIEVKVVFANTGQEHEETLKFVKACDDRFNFKTVWLEALPDENKGGRNGTANVVCFDSASRDGAPFERAISKRGIPNVSFPHCSEELKKRPIDRWLRSIGWTAGSYETAIGIRADEIDRMSPSARERKVVYPLVRWGVKKADVLAWWRQQDFDLALPEHYGNCVWCWKKSLRKLTTLAAENPGIFDFPLRMEQLYAEHGPGDLDRPRRFFRGKRSVSDLLKLAGEPFDPFVDKAYEESNGCSESCEVPL